MSSHICGHGRPQGGKPVFASPLEIGTKTQTFLARKRKISSLILAMTVCWPIWHSHCTKVRFTVLVITCGDELAIHLIPSLTAGAGSETRERIVLILTFVS